MTPLPKWTTITVVLALLALLAYNIIVAGPEGYPSSVIIGGLLGAYIGGQELAKRNNREDGKGGEES